MVGGQYITMCYTDHLRKKFFFLIEHTTNLLITVASIQKIQLSNVEIPQTLNMAHSPWPPISYGVYPVHFVSVILSPSSCPPPNFCLPHLVSFQCPTLIQSHITSFSAYKLVLASAFTDLHNQLISPLPLTKETLLHT